jgi:hypothetical protein
MPPKTKLPVLDSITAFIPTPESMDADVLQYEKLEPMVTKNIPFEQERWDSFLHEGDSIEELAQGRKLAELYLIKTALEATSAQTPASRALWAERFTQASVEMYGEPDVTVATQILSEQLALFSSTGVDPRLPEAIVSVTDVAEGPAPRVEEKFLEDAQLLGTVLEAKYSAVFDLLPEDDSQMFNAVQVADLFEQALVVLSQEDSTWADPWKVVVTDDDKLSVNGQAREVRVGAHRTPIAASKLKGLLAHEILVHANRAVNGSNFSEQSRMRKGLPGYLNSEEGLGVYAEFAVTGEVSQKMQDRYVDTSLALGQIGKTPLTRAELHAFAYQRAAARKLESGETVKSKALERETWSYVNRIYRGSRGDVHSGVFTKDIGYYEGFLKIGGFIHEQLQDGVTPEALTTYLLSAKFDPTEPTHAAMVNLHTNIS